MKIFLYVIGGVVVLALLAGVVAAVVGSRLPKAHVASGSRILRQPPQQVYAVARNFQDAPSWRSDVSKIEVVDGPPGQVRFREHGKHGVVNYGLVEDVPGQRMVTRILDTDLGYSGSWTYVFAASGDGTQLTITENGEVSNVMFRFMSRYFFSQTATIEAYLSALDRQLGTPRPVTVTVDGHQLRLFVTDRTTPVPKGAAPPTIVLEAGGNSTHRIWGSFEARLAQYARVVSYDRAGFGESAACPRPRTARIVAEELREALGAAGIAPPYLMVGFSLGGAFLRVFAAAAPADVTGLVFIDPVPPQAFYDRAEREQPELFRKIDGDPAPPGDKPDLSEMGKFEESLAQALAADPRITAPIEVITSDRPDLGAIGPIWLDAQEQWAKGRPRTRLTIVNGAKHAIYADHPDVVVDAILRRLATK